MKETIEWNDVSVDPKHTGQYLVATMVDYGPQKIMEFKMLDYDEGGWDTSPYQYKICLSFKHIAWAQVLGPKV